jgi:hypothetical protein
MLKILENPVLNKILLERLAREFPGIENEYRESFQGLKMNMPYGPMKTMSKCE